MDRALRSGVFTDPEVVYRSTPAEITAIVEGHAAREKARAEFDAELLFCAAGTICAAINNQYWTPGRKWWTWKDFFPGADPKYAGMTKEEIREAKIREGTEKILMMYGKGGKA